jgi:hypothetical protein
MSIITTRRSILGGAAAAAALLLASCTPSNFAAERTAFEQMLPGRAVTNCKLTETFGGKFGPTYDGTCEVAGRGVLNFSTGAETYPDPSRTDVRVWSYPNYRGSQIRCEFGGSHERPVLKRCVRI